MIDEARNELSRHEKDSLDREWSEEEQLRRDAPELADVIRDRAYSAANKGDVADLNQLFHLRQSEEEQIRAEHRAFHERLRDKLQKSGKYNEDKIAEILADFDSPIITPGIGELGNDPSGIIWETLILREAEDAVYYGIEERAARIVQLHELITRIFPLNSPQPPASSLKFLRLVGRCFISGFSEECVVLCRSVLDTAFREQVSEEMLARRRHQQEGREPGLLQRIEAACPDLIDDEIRKLAVQVKDRGDKAVHYDPTLTKDILGTIRATLRVLNALFPARE